jgi:hypothetical protein
VCTGAQAPAGGVSDAGGVGSPRRGGEPALGDGGGRPGYRSSWSSPGKCGTLRRQRGSGLTRLRGTPRRGRTSPRSYGRSCGPCRMSNPLPWQLSWCAADHASRGLTAEKTRLDRAASQGARVCARPSPGSSGPCATRTATGLTRFGRVPYGASRRRAWGARPAGDPW